ncbi:MAG: hypothetical protein OEW58_02125 [Gammaproteobacteria bacterium]|nr:hypothetical protein [Gammaproteobacteria bacterium]
MRSIVVEPTATAGWHSLVHEAEALCEQHLHQESESYLVFLLMRFLQRPEMGSRILATDYLESFLAHGERRKENLREVGDHCLLFSGLFPQIAERRRVKVSYYVNLGRSAYGVLSEEHHAQLADMYQVLCEEFVPMMDVLQAVRKLGQNQPNLNPLAALELWLDTGSRQALDSLGKTTSATPVKGSGQRH